MKTKIFPCDFGYAIISTHQNKICSVAIEKGKNLSKLFPFGAVFGGKPTELEQRVLDCIDGKLIDNDIPLELTGSAFQLKVWQALCTIGYGQKITYKQLAEMIGKPKAFRAVANACGRNPVAVVIPCHRVIRSDGTIGGYRWGEAVKENLLQRESY